MLTEICQELRNWFNRNLPVYNGDFEIANGELVGFSDRLLEDQYYRIVGSIFNDGVHKYGDADLKDETFTGSVCPMAIPAAVLALDAKIEAWETKYGAGDGVERSPFASESWGGYSYSKSAGGYSGDSSGSRGGSWQSAFAYDLNKWRRI